MLIDVRLNVRVFLVHCGTYFRLLRWASMLTYTGQSIASVRGVLDGITSIWTCEVFGRQSIARLGVKLGHLFPEALIGWNSVSR